MVCLAFGKNKKKELRINSYDNRPTVFSRVVTADHWRARRPRRHHREGVGQALRSGECQKVIH